MTPCSALSICLAATTPLRQPAGRRGSVAPPRAALAQAGCALRRDAGRAVHDRAQGSACRRHAVRLSGRRGAARRGRVWRRGPGPASRPARTPPFATVMALFVPLIATELPLDLAGYAAALRRGRARSWCCSSSVAGRGRNTSRERVASLLIFLAMRRRARPTGGPSTGARRSAGRREIPALAACAD